MQAMPDRVSETLERYRLTEASIHAWVEVNPQQATGDGPLQGVPFGVKDIFETAGMATEYGSPLYAGRKGVRDAGVVSMLRAQGAVLFGKTCTAAFAYFDPPETRNPRNLSHTPGGSSSGSAAAVAAGVVPFALGTQTMGSIVRPASFCGVVGFKPTFGALPVDGVLPFAPSLDTVGWLAESVGVCAGVWRALRSGGESGASPRFGVPDALPAVSAEMKDAFDRVLDKTQFVDHAGLPFVYDELLSAARMVNDYEGARSHLDRWREFGNRIGVKLSALVERGIGIAEADYLGALDRIARAREAMNSVFDSTPVLLTPAAPGCAPEGLSSTGDPMMNAVWTALGTPAISIPMPVGNALPMGLQMIARNGCDDMLLGAAAELEALFKP